MGSSDQTSTDLAAALQAVSVDGPDESLPVVVQGGVAFADLSAQGVRPDHAKAAVENCDGLATFAYQDSGMVVATKLIEIPGKPPYALLAVGADRDGQRTIAAAYRIYPAAGEDVTALATDARYAFQVFLERYALPYKADDRWVIFVPVVIQQPDADGGTSIVEMAAVDDSLDWVVHTQFMKNFDGTVTASWPYVLNTTAYRRDVKRHQS